MLDHTCTLMECLTKTKKGVPKSDQWKDTSKPSKRMVMRLCFRGRMHTRWDKESNYIRSKLIRVTKPINGKQWAGYKSTKFLVSPQ